MLILASSLRLEGAIVFEKVGNHEIQRGLGGGPVGSLRPGVGREVEAILLWLD